MLNRKAKIHLITAVAIMASFFIIQASALAGFMIPSYGLIIFDFVCIALFVPSILLFSYEVNFSIKTKRQTYDDKMRAINNANMVVIFDASGVVLNVNKMFCQATGYKESEITGQHHSILLFHEDIIKSEYNTLWSELNRGICVKAKHRRRKVDGSEIWVYGAYSPIRNANGKVYQIIKIASDVTEEHSALEQLLHSNVYLEHAAKILRHDMHSGINTYIPRGIKGLERRITKEDIDRLKIASSLKLIKEGLLHAQRVYKGVFEFTNLVKKDSVLEKDNYDLREILVNHISKTAYADCVQIKEMPVANVNEALFCTAIDNLIRNGLKYNDSATKIVTVKMIDEDTVGIIDNGRGMSQEEFKLFCKPYERKESQAEPGTGLGLNISVAIFKEHGFDMSVEKLLNGTLVKVKIND
jgi:two-component system, sensor histidine kinase and response regulator